MECKFCPGTEWFELVSSCGFKFGKTSRIFIDAESSLENARKYAEYRLTPEELYFYKDDKIAIFRDVHPNTKFHVLVTPIMHIEQPDGLVKYPEILNHMFKVALDLINNFEDIKETQLYLNQRNLKYMQDFTKHVHLQVTSTTAIPFADIREFFRSYSP